MASRADLVDVDRAVAAVERQLLVGQDVLRRRQRLPQAGRRREPATPGKAFALGPLFVRGTQDRKAQIASPQGPYRTQLNGA